MLARRINNKGNICYKHYLIRNLFEDNTESKCKYLRRYSSVDFNDYLEEINNMIIIKQSDGINVRRPKYAYEGVNIED